MTRLGNAESGVSMWSRSRFPSGFVLMGGAGRANGLGGPDAPAESTAFVDGDGGGRTTPWPTRIGVAVAVPPSLGDESAVALPPSDCSLGICTFNRGRFASAAAPPGRIGPGIEEREPVRCEGPGGGACMVGLDATVGGGPAVVKSVGLGGASATLCRGAEDMSTEWGRGTSVLMTGSL